MTAVNCVIRLLFGTALTLSVTAAATISSGFVNLDNGVTDRNSRGFGRGLSIDLVSTNPAFELSGSDSDTTFVLPGTISGGFAFAPDLIALGRVASNHPATFQDGSGSYLCPGSCFISGSLSFSTPGIDLPANPVAGTTYVLTTPFQLNASHLALAGLGSSPGQGTLDDVFTGTGTATLKVIYGPLSPGDAPTFYVQSTRFDFGPETPEPSTSLLVAGGLAGLAFVRGARNRSR
ncbi:MAG: hypothetical protein ABUS49_07810 [Acidobacteriota bacterium]